MSTIRNPVGPQPPRVYWRRRLLVLLGVLVLILIIVLIVVRPGGGGKPTAANTPKSTSTASTSSTDDPGKVTTCSKSILDVEAATDATTYAPGVDPKISLTIQNNGTKACTFSAGSDVQVYTITSGSEKIWSSKDCQKDPVAKTVTLQPGVPIQSTPFAWDRTRSDPATCSKKSTKQVVAGGASYHLTVAVGGVASGNDIQFILK